MVASTTNHPKAVEGVRTLDPELGKIVCRGSNYRLSAWEASLLLRPLWWGDSWAHADGFARALGLEIEEFEAKLLRALKRSGEKLRTRPGLPYARLEREQVCRLFRLPALERKAMPGPFGLPVPVGPQPSRKKRLEPKAVR